MKTIKQPLGSKLCYAACVAMVAGLELDDVLAEVKLHAEGWLPNTQAIIFLANRGFALGCLLGFDSHRMEVIRDIPINYPMEDRDAIVTVNSNSSDDYLHCIVWDHTAALFRDPNPNYGEFTFPMKYVFREWNPVYKIEGY